MRPAPSMHTLRVQLAQARLQLRLVHADSRVCVDALIYKADCAAYSRAQVVQLRDEITEEIDLLRQIDRALPTKVRRKKFSGIGGRVHVLQGLLASTSQMFPQLADSYLPETRELVRRDSVTGPQPGKGGEK